VNVDVLASAMTTRVDSRDIGALEELGALGGGAAGGHVDGAERIEAQSVLGDRVSNALGVEQVGLVVEVVDVVTGLVVVDVEGNAGLATKQGGFLLRLGHLGAGEEAARGDAVLDESGVVRAAAELGGHVVGAVALIEVLKLLLNGSGAGRASKVEGAAIAVVDAVNVVGAGDLFELC
jgi:hypothetical protein